MTLIETNLEIGEVRRGKVRDIYELSDSLLFIATDRLSAFDVVFNEGVPDKGKILTQLSLFWAEILDSAKPFHFLSEDIASLSEENLSGRAMLVEKLDMFPVECVVRGYLVGSGWKDYLATGMVCGHILPQGMMEGDALPTPILTPAMKAEQGEHDENIDFDRACEIVGTEIMTKLKDQSLALFIEAAEYAKNKGLILVDTKFEFGQRADGTIVLADEILTPDSSRYWDKQDFDKCNRGEVPDSFDKQIVRNYLETLGWNKSPPPPNLPQDIVDKTSARYKDLFNRLTERVI